MTNHSLEMLDEHVSGQAEWRWLEANARRSGALFCPVFMNDRSVESQTSHVGRVLPVATSTTPPMPVGWDVQSPGHRRGAGLACGVYDERWARRVRGRFLH
jgi:hypothetical protein